LWLDVPEPPEHNVSSSKLIILLQPGDRGALKGVIRGVKKDARTRGFPSSPHGESGFFLWIYLINLRLSTQHSQFTIEYLQTRYELWVFALRYHRRADVCFGSEADISQG
jgi:hypothetical protein